ncbi:MAG: Uma2 family endonuclease [Isosphaeraceae bacterium]
MSTVSKSRSPRSPKAGSFRLGYRYVRVVAPDGTETFDQVPLTEEDVLFPKIGDFIVQREGHIDDMVYLRAVFRARLADNPTAAVVTDSGVNWNLPGVRPLCPDAAVFFDSKEKYSWDIFNVAAYGARPALVVEITSPSTRKNDLGPKVHYYHRAKVPVYLIVDSRGRGEKRRIELIAYQYTPEEYQRIQPDAQGRIWLEAVRLWIGVTRDARSGLMRLACYEPETGEEIADYTALAEAYQRAQTEALAAKQESRKAKRQLQAETKRAEAETKRAEAEAKARAQAEARIRELEAELKRARGRGN